MAEIIDARVKQKTGTATEFAGYTLLEGEIALVRTSANGPVWNFKVGPGLFDSLDWSLQNPGAAQKADTSTVFPVGVPGLYIPTEDGTYEGETVDLSVGYVQLIWDGSALVKAEFPIDLAGYAKKTDFYRYEPKYDASYLTNTGFIRPDGTTGTTGVYSYTDYLEISEGALKAKVNFRLDSTSASPLVFYDENQDYISGVTIPSGGTFEAEYDIPNGAKYFRSSCRASHTEFQVSLFVEMDIATQEDINEATLVNVGNFITSDMFVNTGFIRPDGSSSDSANYRYTDPIDVAGVTNIYMHTTAASLSVSPAVFFDEDNQYLSGVTGIVEESDYEIKVPDGARYVVSSIRVGGLPTFSCRAHQFVKYLSINASTSERITRCYISPTGDDGNTGTTAGDPIQSLSRAAELLDPMGELLMLAGDYVALNLDLSLFAKVTGIGKVRIIGGQHFTSATATGGYSRVFQVNHAATIQTTSYLWQHDIEDEETVILAGERHPFHRGRRVRIPSTRIYPATSIAEIEATTDKLMWFQDSGVLYFSIASGSNLSDNPVVLPDGMLVASSNRDVRIRNIEVLYTTILTTGLTGLFENVQAGMSNMNGAIRYDNTVGLTFRHCEAYGCRNDGFNGHTTAPSYTRTQVFFVDCYAHDNSDDGESCHEYCDITHNGGLYEYNGNGITPASGGHAVCNNVLVRNHGDYPWTTDKAGTGFSAQGASQDDGIGTNIYCFGCVSENNTIGFRGLNDGGGSKAINCVSKDDTTAYTNIDEINCVTL